MIKYDWINYRAMQVGLMWLITYFLDKCEWFTRMVAKKTDILLYILCPYLAIVCSCKYQLIKSNEHAEMKQLIIDFNPGL